MDGASLSRRSLLHAIAATIATAAVPFDLADVVHAMDQGHGAAPPDGIAKISLLGAADAADIEAVAAQIVPGDDSPGAPEAGVTFFIPRPLPTFSSRLPGDSRAPLAAFQAGYRERHPGAASFASLPAEKQIDHLKSIEQTPFFTTPRLLTLLGMFSLPAYGGNRDDIGWKMIGLEERHVFSTPFGDYVRDSTCFVVAAR